MGPRHMTAAVQAQQQQLQAPLPAAPSPALYAPLDASLSTSGSSSLPSGSLSMLQRSVNSSTSYDLHRSRNGISDFRSDDEDHEVATSSISGTLPAFTGDNSYTSEFDAPKYFSGKEFEQAFFSAEHYKYGTPSAT